MTCMLHVCVFIIIIINCACAFELYFVNTVNQQILAAIKFGVSQNKVIWRLLNLASPRGPSMQCTIDVYFGGDKY